MLCYCVLVQVCDGYNDCINSEDESNCGTTCQNNGFRCRGANATARNLPTKCVEAHAQCDGLGECSDVTCR